MAPGGGIFGCAGAQLGPDEAAFFREADPWGFILFARNVQDPAQLSRLTADLRAAVGRDAPILVDQEGGRVQRLMPPHWSAWPNARDFLAAIPAPDRAEAMRLRYRVIGAELAAVGIDVNCAPLGDVARAETHPAIAERLYGTDPSEVARLGRAAAEGLMSAGVLPVLKHMPGHGRAPLDTHVALPRVAAPLASLRRSDFVPFAALADLPMGMTGHIVFDAIDPQHPATQSPAVIALMRAEIGFEGLLMSDDLSMQALSGPIGARAAAALAAGCDVALHCNGDLAEMAAVAAEVPRLTGKAAQRAEHALAARAALTPQAVDIPAARDRIDQLTGHAAHA